MLKALKEKLKGIYFDLINTGERPLLEIKFEEINSDQQFAYQLASKYLQGKTVLDFGCGGGYGTEFLSRFTKRTVTGYDIDSKTIQITNNFFKKPNLKFISSSESIKEYDVVTMFQAIEHLGKYLSKILGNISKKYLKEKGIFICSTPNKLITSPGLKKPIMVFHEIEYTPAALSELLEKYFNKVKILGQLEVFKTKPELTRTANVRKKITRIISQIEPVRIISRHLPIKFKYLLMGNLLKETHHYQLTTKNGEIEKSFTLIAICQN